MFGRTRKHNQNKSQAMFIETRDYETSIMKRTISFTASVTLYIQLSDQNHDFKVCAKFKTTIMENMEKSWILKSCFSGDVVYGAYIDKFNIKYN